MTVTFVSHVARRAAAISGAGAVALAAALTAPAAATVRQSAASSGFGRAVEISPPPQNTKTGRDDTLTGVSCPRAGECAAVGVYVGQSFTLLPMVTALTSGHWRRLTKLRLPSNAIASEFTAFTGVSCAAAGQCVGVGSFGYNGGAANTGFIATSARGNWKQAFAPRLPANATKPASALLSGVACTSARDCVAVGTYRDKSGNTQLMVVAETAGRWRQAQEIVAPPHAQTPVIVRPPAVSCFTTGGCLAVAGFVAASGTLTPLLFTQSRGQWHRATAIGLPANALSELGGSLTSVSCTGSGLCAAVGEYQAKGSTNPRPLAVTGTKGLAKRASEVTAAPPAAGPHPFTYGLLSVSCGSPKRCVAVGDVQRSASGAFQAVALTWQSGRWGGGQEIRLPSDAQTNSEQTAALNSVSCLSTGYCAGAGGFTYVRNPSLNASAMASVMP